MYTLKGIFPEPKKDQKKNFIRENMKQLKYMQEKPKEPRLALKGGHLSRQGAAAPTLGQVSSSPSNRSGRVTLHVGKKGSLNSHKLKGDVRIKKGDMAEFLKRKELRQTQQADEPDDDTEDSAESSGRLRDIGCQTLELNNLAQKLADSTKLTMLYPKEGEDSDVKSKASGDAARHSVSPKSHALRAGEDDMLGTDRNRSRLNAILERKDNRDPYLPQGYQKGVVPKYLRSRKEQEQRADGSGVATDEEPACPPGHVTLPDAERKETLRMLRNSFAELVNELNKMPVKTDTLRMKNRKMELEKQLAKLEEGIKVFSRPKVFVKIGE